ncbi:hypothetical protein SORBI_3006G033900, partial [Sorghum bicolor]
GEFAGWGRRAGRSRTGAGRGGVLDDGVEPGGRRPARQGGGGRRPGRRGGAGGRSRTGAGQGGVLDAAERAPAGAACWTQPNGRWPRRRAGCRRAGIGRATGWRRASTGGDVVDGASAGAVEWIRVSGVGRPVSGYDGSGRRAGRQTQGRRGGCRARGLEWRRGGCRARGLEWP